MNKKNVEIERFLAYEDNYGFSFAIDNVKIWKYIREYIYDSYINCQFQTEDRVYKFKEWKFRLYLALQFYKIFIPEKKVNKKDLVILSFPRHVKVKNKYICIQFEAIMKALKNDFFLIENPFWIEDKSYLISHFSKRKCNYIFTDKNELSFRFIFPFIKIIWKDFFRRKYKNKINSWLASINFNLGLNIKEKEFFDFIFYYYCFEKYSTNYYLKLLSKINPKCILEVYTPNHQIALLNTVAHRLKIPIIDLQHGAIGEYEPIMHTYARKGQYEHLYDYIFMFGKYWCNKRNSHLEKECMIPVGVPFLEKLELEVKKNHTKKDTILIISQTRYSDVFFKIAKKIKGEEGLNKYKIILKLHPYEHAKYKLGKYKELTDSGVEVICGQATPVYDLYENAYCVIGINSTCLYEALFFGIPIFVFESKYGVNDLLELKKNYSLITSFKDTDTLISLLLEPLCSKYQLLNPKDELFSRNALDNILRYLNFIINSH